MLNFYVNISQLFNKATYLYNNVKMLDDDKTYMFSNRNKDQLEDIKIVNWHKIQEEKLFIMCTSVLQLDRTGGGVTLSLSPPKVATTDQNAVEKNTAFEE